MMRILLFHIRFKSPVRVIIDDDNGDDEIGCRGCVVIIIIMTVGDAEDARVVIIIMTVGDAEDAR